jgi:hypothetical protein
MMSPQQARVWAVLQAKPLRSWTYRELAAASGISEGSLRPVVRALLQAERVTLQTYVYGPRNQPFRVIALAGLDGVE